MSILKTSVALAAIVAVADLAQVATAAGMDDLVAAAKKEGELTVIALPHDWCGYGDVIAGFKAKYNKGPQSPDVVDVGLSFGPQMKKDGLIQAYKVSTWADIPDSMKDADGFWTGDYYGVLSMMVNKDLVKKIPTDWADLMADEYKGMVALSGDPRSSNQATMAIYAAGLASGKADAAEAAKAGLDFFAALTKKGNFVPVAGKAASLAQGATPITVLWDYNALSGRDTLKGNPPVEVVVPKSGVIAGVYVQAISAYAPHVNAAKLWLEYLYSDEGQIGWLKGYCHPARFAAISSMVPANVMAKLPPAAGYAAAKFPTLEEQGAAKAVVAADWDKTVGAAVK
jgi:putative spermidine/putrescine transport system substrate-binding protein